MTSHLLLSIDQAVCILFCNVLFYLPFPLSVVVSNFQKSHVTNCSDYATGYGGGFYSLTFDQYHHDEIVMDHLKFSPFSTDIHKFCLAYQVVEYANFSLCDILKEIRLSNNFFCPA